MADIHDIYQKFLDRRCSREEVLHLMAYFRHTENADDILQLIQDELDSLDDLPITADDYKVSERNFQKLQATLKRQNKIRKLKAYGVSAAACLIFAAFGTLFYVYTSSETQKDSLHVQSEHKIMPGANRATLTLADGSSIALSELQSGVTVGDLMRYDDGTVISAPKTTYATLSTPQGGQYRVTLPDGTKVWLNAASSLRYPTQFTGSERRVILTGEAYFEVPKKANQPFIVESNKQLLTVLGTTFNVTAYAEEKEIITTLLEGKVAITSVADQAQSITLRPGQQSMLTAAKINVNEVDATEAIAWKDGKFVFNNTDIHAVMRQIARWYDAEIVFTDDLSDVTFSGSLSRFADINDILSNIELTHSISLKVKGRRIMVGRR